MVITERAMPSPDGGAPPTIAPAETGTSSAAAKVSVGKVFIPASIAAAIPIAKPWHGLASHGAPW
jgi:hypothetical protein